MRVLILGSGAQGAVMARYLAHSEAIDRVVCADVSAERAAAAVRFARGRKAAAARLDAANPRALARALAHVDFAVNAAHPRFNLPLSQACARAGVGYQDLAADYDAIGAQLRLSRSFARKGQVGLMHCGGSPGVTNVVAREAVEELDRVDAIRIRLVSKQESTRPVSLWSVAVMLEDMAEPPAVFRDGKVIRMPPFSEEETFDFPEPFGPQRVVHHMHEEPLTFGRLLGKGLRYVDLKMGGAHVFDMREAMRLGLLGARPVQVGKTSVVPRDLLVALSPPAATPAEVTRLLRRGVLKDALGCHVVQAEGERDGARRIVRFTLLGPSLRDVQGWMPGATNMSYRVGVSAALLVEMAAKGEVAPWGIYPPEGLGEESRHVFLERLDREHLKVERSETAGP